MKSQVLNSAMSLLSLVRAETDAIGISLSFGKDSLVTLDLATKVFPRVEAFYLFRVADLSMVNRWAFKVHRRYGITVRMYPHFDLSRLYRYAILQPHWNSIEKTPRVSMLDIENFFRYETEIDWIAYGWRRSDSRSRALCLKQSGGYDPKARRVFPLRFWRRRDVYRYLISERLWIPPSLGRKKQGGLDFHPDALRALKRNPADWKKWLTDFPFSEVQLAHSDRKNQACPDRISAPRIVVASEDKNKKGLQRRDPRD